MFKLFHHRQELAEATSLSRFVRETSSAEKRRIYANVITKASEEQRQVMESAAAIKRDQERKRQLSAGAAV